MEWNRAWDGRYDMRRRLSHARQIGIHKIMNSDSLFVATIVIFNVLSFRLASAMCLDS